MHLDPIPPGLCQCGCGERTSIAPKTDRSKDWTRGEPLRFKLGHNGRKRIRYILTPGPLDTACHISTLVTFEGYAHEVVAGVTRRAHVVAWEDAFGPVPIDRVLDHLCRNRSCVNPAHLEPVTHRENALRGIGPTAVNAQKTHCLQGHPLSGDNLYRFPDGRRDCRVCRRRRGREHAQRRRSAFEIVPVNGNRQEETP